MWYVWDGGGAEYMGGTCGSGFCPLPTMSVVREVRGVDGVCRMCMCLSRGGAG